MNNLTPNPKRRRDIELFGLYFILGLIFFHTGRIFDTIPYYVNASPQSLLLTVLVLFFSLFGMPIMFLVSGSTIWHSLGKRTPGEFIRERSYRLLIPFLMGLLLVFPPQVYFSFRQIQLTTRAMVNFIEGSSKC